MCKKKKKEIVCIHLFYVPESEGVYNMSICKVDHEGVYCLLKIRYPIQLLVNYSKTPAFCFLFFPLTHIHWNETSKSGHYYKTLNIEYMVIRHGIQSHYHFHYYLLFCLFQKIYVYVYLPFQACHITYSAVTGSC